MKKIKSDRFRSGSWLPSMRSDPSGRARRAVGSAVLAADSVVYRNRCDQAGQWRQRCSRESRSHVTRSDQSAVVRIEPRWRRSLDRTDTWRWTCQTDSIPRHLV